MYARHGHGGRPGGRRAGVLRAELLKSVQKSSPFKRGAFSRLHQPKAPLGKGELARGARLIEEFLKCRPWPGFLGTKSRRILHPALLEGIERPGLLPGTIPSGPAAPCHLPFKKGRLSPPVRADTPGPAPLHSRKRAGAATDTGSSPRRGRGEP